MNKSWLKDVTRGGGWGSAEDRKTRPEFFFMFNGQENFEKSKDVGGLFLFSLGVGTVCSLDFSYSYSSSLCCSVVASMGVPWTMARSILYFEVLGTYLYRRDVFPEYSPSSLVYCVYNRTVSKFLPRIFHCWIVWIIFLTRSFKLPTK